jgi:hypothetical protein
VLLRSLRKFTLYFSEFSTNVCKFWKFDLFLGNLKQITKLERNSQGAGPILAHGLDLRGLQPTTTVGTKAMLARMLGPAQRSNRSMPAHAGILTQHASGVVTTPTADAVARPLAARRWMEQCKVATESMSDYGGARLAR